MWLDSSPSSALRACSLCKKRKRTEGTDKPECFSNFSLEDFGEGRVKSRLCAALIKNPAPALAGFHNHRQFYSENKNCPKGFAERAIVCSTEQTWSLLTFGLQPPGDSRQASLKNEQISHNHTDLSHSGSKCPSGGFRCHPQCNRSWSQRV